MRRAYCVPLLLAVMTAVGLVLALLAEGVWDVVSSALLLGPITVLGAKLGTKPDPARDERTRDSAASSP